MDVLMTKMTAKQGYGLAQILGEKDLMTTTYHQWGRASPFWILALGLRRTQDGVTLRK
jgi:hypothetical protein